VSRCQDTMGLGQRHELKLMPISCANTSFIPESKCADAHGLSCTRQTIGLLQRRHIRIAYVVPIGKESNSLEDVESGLIHSEPNVYTVYPDPERDEWEMKIRPALKKMPLDLLVKLSGMSRRALLDIRAGKSRPHRINRELLIAVLRGESDPERY
jgi:hypothetical protein